MMDLLNKELNRLNAFFKGKKVMRTIPSSELPKGTDLTKYRIKKGPKKDSIKPFVRERVNNIVEL